MENLNLRWVDDDHVWINGKQFISLRRTGEMIRERSEIVRCSECRYAPTGEDNGEDHGFGLIWPDHEKFVCPFQCDDGWYSRKPRPDFFCANGKRKEAAP